MKTFGVHAHHSKEERPERRRRCMKVRDTDKWPATQTRDLYRSGLSLSTFLSRVPTEEP